MPKLVVTRIDKVFCTFQDKDPELKEGPVCSLTRKDPGFPYGLRRSYCKILRERNHKAVECEGCITIDEYLRKIAQNVQVSDF